MIRVLTVWGNPAGSHGLKGDAVNKAGRLGLWCRRAADSKTGL